MFCRCSVVLEIINYMLNILFTASESVYVVFLVDVMLVLTETSLR